MTELPKEIIDLIKEFSMPLSRPDWRLGNYHTRIFNTTIDVIFIFKEYIKIYNNKYKEMF